MIRELKVRECIRGSQGISGIPILAPSSSSVKSELRDQESQGMYQGKSGKVSRETREHKVRECIREHYLTLLLTLQALLLTLKMALLAFLALIGL